MAANGIRVGVIAALLVSVAACGQKGPLYLPDSGGDVVTRPAGQTRQEAPQQQSSPQSQSQETAPQPSTQPQPNSTDKDKQSQSPPR